MNETPPSKPNPNPNPNPNSHSLPPPPTLTAVKSQSQQPLHNFSLPDLKWSMNHTNTNRFRKPSDSSHKSPHYDAVVSDKHKRPMLQVPTVKTGLGVEKLADRKSTSGDGHDVAEKKLAPASSSDGSRSKIFIRIKTKSTKVADEVADAGDHNSDPVVPDVDSDDLLVPKTWNLRPRRLTAKVNNNNIVNVNGGGGALKIGGGAAQEIKPPENKDKDKEKEKEKFSISLKKEEIEDDFFAMTGTKPSRRPKKRAKNVQKQLDYVFPGLWLPSITPDSYKVNNGTKKG